MTWRQQPALSNEALPDAEAAAAATLHTPILNHNPTPHNLNHKQLHRRPNLHPPRAKQRQALPALSADTLRPIRTPGHFRTSFRRPITRPRTSHTNPVIRDAILSVEIGHLQVAWSRKQLLQLVDIVLKARIWLRL